MNNTAKHSKILSSVTAYIRRFFINFLSIYLFVNFIPASCDDILHLKVSSVWLERIGFRRFSVSVFQPAWATNQQRFEKL